MAAGSERLRKYIVARASDIPDGGRLIVDVAGRSIGIFNVDGRFHALLNRCPHKGGDLCRGDVLDLIIADRPGNVRLEKGQKFIVCPWHGWEYDIETGQSWTSPQGGRARPFPVQVEPGNSAAEKLVQGSATAPEEPGSVYLAGSGQRVRGQYRAEVVPVAVQDDYLVLTVSNASMEVRNGR